MSQSLRIRVRASQDLENRCLARNCGKTRHKRLLKLGENENDVVDMVTEEIHDVLFLVVHSVVKDWRQFDDNSHSVVFSIKV